MSKDPESCKNCKPRTTWFAQGTLVDFLWDLRLLTQKDIDVRVKQNTKYYRHLNARNFQRSKILSPPPNFKENQPHLRVTRMSSHDHGTPTMTVDLADKKHWVVYEHMWGLYDTCYK